MFCQKCGHVLGDGAKFCTECGTPTTHASATPTPTPATPTPSPKKKRSVKKMVALFVTLGVLSFLLFFGCIVGLVVGVMNSQKDTEQYKLAEAYILASPEFKKLGVEADALRMEGFSTGTQIDNGKRVQYAEYDFAVDGRACDFYIRLEKTGDNAWSIEDFDYDD